MKKISGFILILILLFCSLACEFEKRIPPKGYLPVDNHLTDSLEASYFWISQNSLRSSYWEEAPYLAIDLQNISTGNLHPEGYLNTSGTYKGIEDFNEGRDPQLRLKAGYDEEYIYLLVEWNDTTLNPSYLKRLFHGPEDPLKADSSTGWTSQGNQDAFQIHFDVDGYPSKDVWKWSLATTAPFNMALNLSTDGEGRVIEDTSFMMRNGSEDTSRAPPMYEWNGVRQEVVLPDGSIKTIDAGYFLLDEFKTSYSGNPLKGQRYFNDVASCSYCHGPNGNGEPEVPYNNEGGLDYPISKSREDLIDFIDDHPGGATTYFGRIKNDPEKVNDLLAFMRGIGGVPGYILKVPETSGITALANVGTTVISSTKNSRYQVLLRRKLQNNTPGDIQFEPGMTYSFSILLSDGDNLNYVGASNLMLIFKRDEI